MAKSNTLGVDKLANAVSRASENVLKATLKGSTGICKKTYRAIKMGRK